MIREVQLQLDLPALRELDTSFTTDVVYEVRCTEDTFQLVSTPVRPPLTKRFPLDQLNEPPWDAAYVALLDDRLCGVVAARHERWNKRLVIQDFYVHAPYRRQGVGRLLLERAIDRGAALGATTAWVETSSVNHPGVQAYRRLGFELCGLDLALYRGTPAEGEAALFLARPVGT